MKKLNITKERFEKSRYFTKKYGKLEYVSESGNLYKTSKGKVLMFVKESSGNTRRKLVKESTGENVEVCAVVKGRGRTIEEAIENFDREIDNLSSDKWGDWTDNYDPETDEYKDRDYWTAEYNKWQEENGGDVDITVVDDRGNADGLYGYVTISNTDEY